MRERETILELWRGAHRRGTQAVLATVCEVEGSAYRRPGARMLLCADGAHAGVINGGCLDGDLWRRAREVMASGEPQLALYDSTPAEDILWGSGVGCRGIVKILLELADDLSWLGDGHTAGTFFEGPALGTELVETSAGTPEGPHLVDTPRGRALVETFLPPPPLWIFGAGADAVPLVRLGESFGWRVEVVDPRAPHPDRPRRLPARHLPLERFSELEISPRAACVVMTHNFLHDLEILRAVLPSPARYVGVLGPRSRTEALLAALPRNGVLPGVTPTADQLDRLHAPIGLDIGAETPEEIALAILAEIRAVCSGRSGGFLRARAGRIHASADEPVWEEEL